MRSSHHHGFSCCAVDQEAKQEAKEHYCVKCKKTYACVKSTEPKFYPHTRQTKPAGSCVCSWVAWGFSGKREYHCEPCHEKLHIELYDPKEDMVFCYICD